MVELKPFDIENADIHFKWNNDEELNFYDSDYPLKFESYDNFVNRISLIAEEKIPTSRLLEIHHSNLKTLIGIVDIHHIDHHNMHCYIECSIGDPSFRHKGYGTAALRKGLRYCFEKLGMRKVSATSFDFNKKWIGILSKMGFKHEGTLRKHVKKEDSYCNKLIFSILKEEYMLSRNGDINIGMN